VTSSPLSSGEGVGDEALYSIEDHSLKLDKAELIFVLSLTLSPFSSGEGVGDVARNSTIFK